MPSFLSLLFNITIKYKLFRKTMSYSTSETYSRTCKSTCKSLATLIINTALTHSPEVPVVINIVTAKVVSTAILFTTTQVPLTVVSCHLRERGNKTWKEWVVFDLMREHFSRVEENWKWWKILYTQPNKREQMPGAGSTVLPTLLTGLPTDLHGIAIHNNKLWHHEGCYDDDDFVIALSLLL